MRTIHADRMIWVTTSFVGFHSWDNAPSTRAYLRTRHRHNFHVRVELWVGHDDREVEFHDLLDLVNDLLPSPELGGRSCEMIADAIGKGVSAVFPDRPVSVDVSEDGEVGARLIWTPINKRE